MRRRKFWGREVENLRSKRFRRDEDVRRAEWVFTDTLLQTPISIAVDWWKAEELQRNGELRPETVEGYYCLIQDLIKREIIQKCWTVDVFGHNGDFFLECIRHKSDLDEDEQIFRIVALDRFVAFLSEQTKGYIPRLCLPPELNLKGAIRGSSPKVLTLQQWWFFRDALEQISRRDALIAKLLISTARPLKEILALRVGDIELGHKVKVTFQRNSGQTVSFLLDFKIAGQLRSYLVESEKHRQEVNGPLFITRQGRPVFRTHITHVFDRAARKADLGFRVTARMIQWAQVGDMCHRMGCTKAEIMDDMQLERIPKPLEIYAEV